MTAAQDGSAAASMFIVHFCFEEDEPIVVSARAGENLLKLAKRAGVPIQAPCSGLGSCGKCRVQILRGSLDSPPSFYIPDEEYNDGWRLACISKVIDDITILVK